MPQQECQFKLKVQMWHIYLLRKHRCLPQNLLTSPGEKTWAFTRCYYAVWGQNCRISCVITQEIWQCCPRTVTSTMGGGRRFLSRRQYLFFFGNIFCGHSVVEGAHKSIWKETWHNSCVITHELQVFSF